MPDVHVSMSGNATRDPELTYTQAGTARCVFGLAVNRRWQNKTTQEWEEEVSFFNVLCWAGLAENVAESVAKGNRLMVSGRLQQRSWETDNGERRSTVEVVADDVGPSLKWATASVVKAERRGGNGGGSSGGRAPRQAGGSPAPAGGGYDDLGEEPF